jgi:DNA-binding transcriptional LysR family regulator
LLEEIEQLGPVYQGDVASIREIDGLCGESPRRHDKPAGGAPRGHVAIQLPHHIRADLEGAPLLALNEEFLVAIPARFLQHQIDAAIGAATAGLYQLVALQPKPFADEQLELVPRHSVECIRGLARHDVGDEPRLTSRSKPVRLTIFSIS